MLKVSENSSQVALDLSLRGTDFFLPILYDLNNNERVSNAHSKGGKGENTSFAKQSR